MCTAFLTCTPFENMWRGARHIYTKKLHFCPLHFFSAIKMSLYYFILDFNTAIYCCCVSSSSLNRWILHYTHCMHPLAYVQKPKYTLGLRWDEQRTCRRLWNWQTIQWIQRWWKCVQAKRIRWNWLVIQCGQTNCALWRDTQKRMAQVGRHEQRTLYRTTDGNTGW